MKNPWKREMIRKTAAQLITQTNTTLYYYFIKILIQDFGFRYFFQ
jgi:hypothetical protein